MNHNFWLNELGELEAQVLNDLQHWKNHPDYTPYHGADSLLTLARKICALPETYALILNGASDEEVLKAAAGDSLVHTPAALGDFLQVGMLAFRAAFLKLPEIDMKTRELHHVLGQDKTAVALVMELINRMHAVRAELELYLKLA
ncbi:hypothetical protein [Deinococcus roseus]|uniref:Uncharacterized protein n=1 Tax=Deinococcus roseus TaxID=392414 RepID=A0ABQ2D118_9DEIO|nr:hypothetical protein [Deinococcus roseus]GGJ40382.1 hypothetical protein GCM10008938_28080 [Deinococcus roseus]